MLTYFLVLVVVIVWGLIIYRIVIATKSDDDLPAIVSTVKKEPFNDYSITNDTTHLLLNYRDPFGLVAFKDTTKLVIRKGDGQRSSRPVTKPFNWSFIKYSGFVLNPVSKKLVAMVSINGQNTTLSQGETKNAVKLIKNMKDSILVSCNGNTKFISLK